MNHYNRLPLAGRQLEKGRKKLRLKRRRIILGPRVEGDGLPSAGSTHSEAIADPIDVSIWVFHN
jgi:hypothetical protein